MPSQNAAETFAHKIDRGFQALLTNKEILKSASLLMNLNSYRRKWTRTLIRETLVSFELPVRTDQERMLALLEKLNDRIDDLEGQLNARSQS